VKILQTTAILAATLGVAGCPFVTKYGVGGTVVGVRGSGLVLQNNAGGDLKIVQSGTFTFSTKLEKGSTYAVTVATQPSNPAQTCTVNNGSGTITNAEINEVIVVCSEAPRYAYAANQSAGTIAEFSIDSASGRLVPIAGSPIASTGNAPVATAIDPNGEFLYVANNLSNDLSVYAIADATGALTPAGEAIPAGSNPSGLALDPTGRFLYVANTGSDSVSAFSLQHGIATAISGSPYAVGRGPVGLTTNPGGNFLYVTNFTDGSVTAFAIDSATGALFNVSGSPFGAGAGAISVAVNPSSSFAYVANQNAGSISSYSIDISTGALAALSGSPQSTVSAPLSVLVDPAGTFVYAANVTSSNDIASYAVAPASGTLTVSSTSGAEVLPISLAVDPVAHTGGQFLYTTNFTSGTVSVFTVDATTGLLTAVADSPFFSGAGARSIALD
jgi:6-phosphogluconolactonase (cycloisomerase 2 family)